MRTTSRAPVRVMLAGVLIGGLALASFALGSEKVAATGDIRAPATFAPLHLSATPFMELQSRNVGAEVGASFGFTRYTDLGLAAMLGPHLGGRLTLALHPGPDWRVKPLLQLRGVFQPLPGAIALGGGAGVGASLELGPGRLMALAVAEVYRSPPQSLPRGLFAMLGYELDLLKPAPHPPLIERVSAPPAAGPEPAAPRNAPPGSPLRTDDLPPPAYTEPIPDSRPPSPPPAPVAPAPAPEPPPAAGETRVKVKLAIRDRIYFPAHATRIRSRYLPVLKQLAATLKATAIIKKVRIDGYADDKGSDAVNLQLSQLRAREVMNFLIKNGVEPSKLETRGYGRTQPSEQETRKEQEENRRVEFVIVDPPQDGQ